jgi:hypothetical protein
MQFCVTLLLDLVSDSTSAAHAGAGGAGGAGAGDDPGSVDGAIGAIEV